MRIAKQQSNLYGFVLDALEGLADVDAQLAELADVLLVDEFDLAAVCDVEDYAHDGLAGTHRAVDLGVDLVDAHRVAFTDERVEHVLAELLPLDYYFFVLGVKLRVEGCEGVYAVGFFGDAGRD
jgi:hypothetical protein